MPSPLIQAMMEKYNYPMLNEETLDDFLDQHSEVVLFFTEDPARFPESNDVAMILPELAAQYRQRFAVAVIDQASQRKLQARYSFSEWPSLVFLRDKQYLGVISRVQNWAEYLTTINDILAREGSQNPGIGIPVVSASMAAERQ